jgi:WD40 repeat protein/biotin carboxyl carrier protein
MLDARGWVRLFLFPGFFGASAFGQASSLGLERSDLFQKPVAVANARIRMTEEVQVPAETPGVLVEILVREGERVRKGQPLARLNDVLAKLDVKAKRQMAENGAAVEASDFKSKADDAEYQTALRLEKSKSVSQIEVIHKMYQVEADKAQTRNEQSKQDSAKTDLEKAQATLDLHVVKSPIDGIVQQRLKQVGEAVQTLEPIIHLTRPERVKVEAELDLRYVDRLWPGQDVEIYPNLVTADAAPFHHLSSVLAVHIAEDCKRLACGCEDGAVVVWDLAERKRLHVLVAGDRPVRCVRFVPRRPNELLTAGDDGKLSFWDVSTGKLLRTIPETASEDASPIFAAAFELDVPERVYTGGRDGRIQAWDLREGRSVWSVEGHLNRVTTLAAGGKDRPLFSVGDDAKAKFWDAATGGSVRTFGGRIAPKDKTVHQLGLSPDGKEFLFTNEGVLQIRDATTGFPNGEWESTGGSFAYAAVFAGSKDRLLTVNEDSQILLWERETASRPPRLARTYDGHKRASSVERIDVAANGRFFVSAGSDHSARLWLLPSRERLEAERHPARVSFVSSQAERGTDRIAFYAEADNRRGLLTANAGATIVLLPGKPKSPPLGLGAR